MELNSGCRTLTCNSHTEPQRTLYNLQKACPKRCKPYASRPKQTYSVEAQPPVRPWGSTHSHSHSSHIVSHIIDRQPVPYLVKFAEGLPEAPLVLRIQLQAQPLQLVSLPHVLYKAPAGVHQPYMAVPGVGDLVGDLQHKRAAGGCMHTTVHVNND